MAADTNCICEYATRAPPPPLEALRDLLGDAAMRIPAFESKPGAAPGAGAGGAAAAGAAGAAGSVRDWLGMVGPVRYCSPSRMTPFSIILRLFEGERLRVYAGPRSAPKCDARLGVRCHRTPETGVQNALDVVASSMRVSLGAGARAGGGAAGRGLHSSTSQLDLSRV